MKNILIISFSIISKDPRVMRQALALRLSNNVNIVGFGDNPSSNFCFYKLKTSNNSFTVKLINAIKLLFCFYKSYYKKYTVLNHDVLNQLQKCKFDAVVANDVSALPLAFKLAGQAPVFLDAHEYSPREFEDKFLWRVLYGRYYSRLCLEYLPRISGMMTVCQGIADEYERTFGVKSVVVTNAPSYRDLCPSTVQPDTIRMIHHGGAVPSRHLEDMIEMMGYLDDRFMLDFMLVPSSKKYLDQLKSKASLNVRIRFIDPVPMQEIPNVCNKYDIGVYLLPPVSFNSKYALPNKLFEFIQARLAVAIGPSPEMSSVVLQYDCGVVAGSFSPKELAEKLSALTSDQIQYFKNRSHDAAKHLCAEANAQTIIKLVEGVS